MGLEGGSTLPPAAAPAAAPMAANPAVLLASGLLGYYLLALGCIYLSRQPQQVSTMWLPDAFASIWLLLLLPRPRPQRRWLLAGLALVIPLANLSWGDPWRVALSFVPANLLQIVLSAVLIERHVQPARAVRDPLHLLRALALGGAVPALAGATLATLTVPLLMGTPLDSPGGLWGSWLVSTFFGVATLLPMGLWLLARGADLRPLRHRAALPALAAVALVSWAAPLWLPYPFTYIITVLVFVALFGGFLVAAAAALAASVVLNALFALGQFPGQAALQEGFPGAPLLVLPMLVTVLPAVVVGAVREGLSAQLERIRAGEALQRSMLDASPVLLCLVDEAGRIVRMNAAGARLLGAEDPQALAGHALAEMLDEAGAAAVEPPGRHAMLRTLDGRQLCVEWRRAPLHLPDGGGGAVYALRDISAELEARRVREEAERIEADHRAKSEFLSRMSHELRTPLNAVLGFAQLLSAGLGQTPAERQREQLRAIEQSGWHLLAMIDDVLDLARMDAGAIGLKVGPVALAPVIAQARSMVQTEAAARGLVVEQRLPAVEARVVADPVRLCQVLINLLSNAVKYNREGGQVVIAVEPTGGGWRLRVADTGLGIRVEQQAHLFKPFHRLDHAQSAIPGTGIGLAITRRLVEAMGGSIGFSSQPGVGSEFHVTLPMARPGDDGPGRGEGAA